ncbi:methyltransferase N6AMT1-like [Branchiostoma floridae]|uniref:Methyltransferase HEMK2 n=2 Tax=Branchiostoma floridae TaxID=7739 RepID=A0A9J7MRR8_BRAFL|nr:methyltransferase N6AMT1-like [Branchiostoma floridae]
MTMGETFPTPDLSHLTAEDYDHVYEPAEDTFLLMDALEKDADLLRSIAPSICLEVGCGSGAVITFLGSILGSRPHYLCTDLNPRAAECAARTGTQNNISVHPVLTDLVSALLPRLENKVDVMIFNPPYVVTPPEEVGSHGIEASWAGGVKGREVMDRFFPLVPRLLSDNGVFYLVTIEQNDPEEIGCKMREFGFTMDKVMSRKAGPEKLAILRFSSCKRTM